MLIRGPTSDLGPLQIEDPRDESCPEDDAPGRIAHASDLQQLTKKREQLRGELLLCLFGRLRGRRDLPLPCGSTDAQWLHLDRVKLALMGLDVVSLPRVGVRHCGARHWHMSWVEGREREHVLLLGIFMCSVGRWGVGGWTTGRLRQGKARHCENGRGLWET
eukprot:3890207-Rhodomonas_salina.1